MNLQHKFIFHLCTGQKKQKTKTKHIISHYITLTNKLITLTIFSVNPNTHYLSGFEIMTTFKCCPCMFFEAFIKRELFSGLSHPASDLQMYFTKLDSSQSWGRNLRARNLRSHLFVSNEGRNVTRNFLFSFKTHKIPSLIFLE